MHTRTLCTCCTSSCTTNSTIVVQCTLGFMLVRSRRENRHKIRSGTKLKWHQISQTICKPLQSGFQACLAISFFCMFAQNDRHKIRKCIKVHRHKIARLLYMYGPLYTLLRQNGRAHLMVHKYPSATLCVCTIVYDGGDDDGV
jgi:hypothetical protein